MRSTRARGPGLRLPPGGTQAAVPPTASSVLASTLMDTPVMMAHGMCCTGAVWHNFRAFFEARGTRVYTPTLRPHVRTRLDQRPHPDIRKLAFADYIADLEQEALAIERETGKKPAMIGHSMGGLLAQALAERGTVSAAVFISPSPPAGVRILASHVYWTLLFAADRVRLVPRAIKADRRMAGYLALNAVPAARHAAIHGSFVHESGRAFIDLGHWPIDEHKVRIPVLTVSAKRDRLVPAALVRLTAKKYARVGGEFREYAAHGHWLYDEPGWEKPAADIYDWLRAALAAPGEPAVERGRAAAARAGAAG